MLRAAFRLTALLFIPLGLYLYFLPSTVATLAGISPLWLARLVGGLLFAWGAFQMAASFQPDPVKVGGLIGGNLLSVAAIVPPVIRQGMLMPSTLKSVLVGIAAFLLVMAVLALLRFPLPHRRDSL